MKTHRTRGIYFLANDRVVELAIAFLNSLRKYNQDIHICLIPYNDEIKILYGLKNKYNFSIFKNKEVLEICDSISLQLHQCVYGHYRKLAAWEGAFDEFVYIDIDTVIFENINFVFDKLKYFDFITSHSNVAKSVKWVWKKSIFETNLLTQEQIAYGANTGFIVSKQGSITVKSINNSVMEKALILSPHMEFHCKEQPFLNYLIVSSGKEFSSLYQLMDTHMYPENMIELWAGNKIENFADNKPHAYHDGKLRRVFMIHWAGKYQLKRVEQYLYAILFRLGFMRERPAISFFMPHKKIWKHHRALNE